MKTHAVSALIFADGPVGSATAAAQSLRPFAAETTIVTNRERLEGLPPDVSVVRYERQDEMSDARNLAKDRCKGPWILVLSAREALKTSTKVDLLLPSPDVAQQQVYTLSQHRYGGNGMFVGYGGGVRIFSRSAPLHFVDGMLSPVPEAGGEQAYDFVHLSRLYVHRIDPGAPEIPAPGTQMHPAARRYRGESLFENGRFEEAIAEFTQSVQSMPPGPYCERESAVCWRRMVDAYRLSQAGAGQQISVAEKASQAHPDSPDIRLAIGEMLLALDHPAEGVAQLELARTLLLRQPPAAWSHTEIQPWMVDERLCAAHADTAQPLKGYGAALRAMTHKPESSSGWPSLLNTACALALDLNDRQRLGEICHLLLSRDDTSLELLELRLANLEAEEGIEAAQTYLAALQGRYPRAAKLVA